MSEYLILAFVVGFIIGWFIAYAAQTYDDYNNQAWVAKVSASK